MMQEVSGVSGFLADTWWFGLTQRLSEDDFKDLAAIRAAQGFSAIQLVVGIPPEVGPRNENASSPVGFPWTLSGDFNQEYLDFARGRIQYLNEQGFVVIVYGAWGHQIEWLGREKMVEWWLQVLETLDELDVIYCLCGESSLWVGEASKILPDKSTNDLVRNRVWPIIDSRVGKALVGAVRRLRKRMRRREWGERRDAWSFVLKKITQRTDRPVIIHPVVDETGDEAVSDPGLLAANTAQTGHDYSARNRLWQLPLTLLRSHRAAKGFINLEPWYEGIRGQFGAEDQMFAYWVSMLAGATSYCYGAQGIWNVGDGEFLAHWGGQTFSQACALHTPKLLGLSHKQYSLRSDPRGKAFYQASARGLSFIGRKMGEMMIQFFPDIAKVDRVPVGKIWLPLEGVFTEALPPRGQVVVFRE